MIVPVVQRKLEMEVICRKLHADGHDGSGEVEVQHMRGVDAVLDALREVTDLQGREGGEIKDSLVVCNAKLLKP